MMADLSSLPDIDFIEVDAEKITNDIIAVYEALADRSLYPGDPIRLFLTALAQLIIQQRVLINETAKQNLLRYATGDILDHIGIKDNVPRLEATAALTTMQFTLSAPLSSVTVIPAGTRVGPAGGNGLYFETRAQLEIPIGATTGTVDAVCMSPGTIGNGFYPGQINVLIDPIPFVQGVSNLTVSSGGANEETDDAYRERIRIAPESFSVAGPDGAYKFFAMSASPLIVDVSVRKASPGVVEIRPLLQGGQLPDQEILDLVLAACSDRKERPLTDHVQVLAPEIVGYGLEVTYWLPTGTLEASKKAAVEQAVEAYKTWQKSKLGRDIDPSELVARMKAAGAKRVVVTLPTYQEIEEYQVAVENAVTVNYGGLEDD